MYWCNCLEVNRSLVQHISKFAKWGGMSFWQKVNKSKDGACPHCSHTALYSKSDPNADNHFAEEDGAEVRTDKIFNRKLDKRRM